MDATIPYTIEARRDTGLYNAKIGVWLFLASEVMLFGALFSAYVLLRTGSPNPWPHGQLSVPLGALNTVILITSSIMIVMAWAALKMNQFANFKRYLGVTLLCATVFLGVKAYEYQTKFTHHEVRLKDGTVLTGHLEAQGRHAFLTLKKLQKMKVDKFEFHADGAEGAARSIALR